MSSDARAWKDPVGGWLGSHDGPCTDMDASRVHSDPWSLTEVLDGLEACLDRPLRWEIEDGGERGLMLFGWTA